MGKDNPQRRGADQPPPRPTRNHQTGHRSARRASAEAASVKFYPFQMILFREVGPLRMMAAAPPTLLLVFGRCSPAASVHQKIGDPQNLASGRRACSPKPFARQGRWTPGRCGKSARLTKTRGGGTDLRSGGALFLSFQPTIDPFLSLSEGIIS